MVLGLGFLNEKAIEFSLVFFSHLKIQTPAIRTQILFEDLGPSREAIIDDNLVQDRKIKGRSFVLEVSPLSASVADTGHDVPDGHCPSKEKAPEGRFACTVKWKGRQSGGLGVLGCV